MTVDGQWPYDDPDGDLADLDENEYSSALEALFEEVMQKIYPPAFLDAKYQNCYPQGFPIHAFCWDLLKEAVGPQLEEGELELAIITDVLQKRWTSEAPFY